MDEFDEDLDDWFIESLKTYKDLHVFQLDFPTRVLEWTSSRTVCVASEWPEKKELLELRLPPRLLAGENKGLCAERDFRVLHGGFTDGPVCGLLHVPGTRSVVTSDGRSSNLQVWDLGGDDTDVVKRTGMLAGRGGEASGGTRMAAPPSSPPAVLHGGRLGDVSVTELASRRRSFQLGSASSEALSSLHCLSRHVFLAACWNGSIYMADSRVSATPELSAPPPSPGETVWRTDVAVAAEDTSTCKVLRVSSSGEAAVSDLRSPTAVASRAQLDVSTPPRNMEDIRVSWAPPLDAMVSVSGFSGDVHIYDSSAWGAEPRRAHPLFRHRGHAASAPSGVAVTAHIWHPERPRTLLSAASDGSVHVWEWVDQSGADAWEREAATL